jgi:hypothetical protein
MTSMGLLRRKTMDKRNSTFPKRELQVIVKPLMTFELERIAEREGVSDPTTLVLLQIARLINEKKDGYSRRRITI